MKKLLTLIILLKVVLFTSCSSLMPISYERLWAADVNYPDLVQNVGLVTCLSSCLECTEDSVVLPATFVGDGKVATEVMAQEIAAIDYFDQVLVCDSVLDSSEMISSNKDSLIQALGVDLLFVLKRLDIQLSEGMLFVPELIETVPAVDAIVDLELDAYIEGREVPLFVFNKKDTITWKAISSLSLENVIDESSEYAAIMPMKHLLPYWRNVSRCYFDGGHSEMRDAGVCVKEQDWETAYLLWKQVFETKKGRLKWQAAYNLALYYELQDDFSKALELLSIALDLVEKDSSNKQQILLYQSQLMGQIENYQKLKVQMNRFEDKKK